MKLYVISLLVLTFCFFSSGISVAENTEIIKSSAIFPENAAAVVNDDAITLAELTELLRKRYKKIEKITSKSVENTLNLLIDRRLIFQEAYRMGLHEDPEVIYDTEKFIRIQSIIKFRGDFIIEAAVRKEDILNSMKEQYGQREIESLQLKDEKSAEQIFQLVEKGRELESLKEEGTYWKGKITRGTYGNSSLITEAAFSETADDLLLIKADTGVFIIKILGEISVPKEMQAKLVPHIEKRLRHEKQKQDRQAFLKEWGDKAVVEIDDELLQKLNSEELLNGNDWQSDTRVIATINDEPITVRTFLEKYKGYSMRLKSSTLSQEEKNKRNMRVVIGTSVESQAALERKYYQKSPAFREMVDRHQERVINGLFYKRVILPKIKPTIEDLERYYQDNIITFSKPDKIALKGILVENKAEAEKLLRELKKGANINFLSENFSLKHQYDGWKSITELSEPIAREVQKLEVGEISGIIPLHYNLLITKVVGRKKGEPYPFQEVRGTVEERYAIVKGRELLKEMAAILRKNSVVKINTPLLTNLPKSLHKQQSERNPGS